MKTSIAAITQPNWKALPYDATLREVEGKYGLESPLAFAAWLMLKEQEAVIFSRWRTALNNVYAIVHVQNDSKIFGVPLLDHTFYDNDMSCIISGSLNQWREAIISGLQKQNKAVRILSGHCFLLFEQHGFGHLFLAYQRVGAADGTFYLRAKDGN